MNKNTLESLRIVKYITAYLNVYLPSHQTSSSHTQKNYRITLQLYLEFLEEKNISIDNVKFNDFNSKNIEEWLVWLSQNRNNKPQSINNRLAAIRVFLEYLGRQDISLYYLYVESKQIKRRKQPKIKVKGVSKNGMKHLFAAIDQSTATGRRDLTLFILMYNTATRINELLSLKIDNLFLDVENPYINIVGKGNKLRSLYLLPKTVSYLRKYIIEFHGTSQNKNSYLFYSKIKGKDTKLTQPAIEKQLKKWASIANKKCNEVPLTLHPHQIRHAAACHWLEDGINIVQISYLLGHEQLQTTMVYLEITTVQKTIALEAIESNKQNNKLWKNNLKKLSDICK